MIKTPINLQDLRRRIYVKAKAEPSWRFWGLYVHVCKLETLSAAYRLAKRNNGAPGVDGTTFADIEKMGVKRFLTEIQEALQQRTYRPSRVRKVGIPKGGGKTRHLSIPTIRDRVVQGALKLILEPIFEADFQPGSYGYRPRKSAHGALDRVSEAILRGKTVVIDIDLKTYFDTIQHGKLLQQVAKRVQDNEVLHLLKQILKASGKKGVPQGGVISPLLSNLYLNSVDQMLERAKESTRLRDWTLVEYARFADDLVVLIDGHPRGRGLRGKVEKRLREELRKLGVEINEDKSKAVYLLRGDPLNFLGFQFHRIRTRGGRWMPLRIPQPEKRKDLLRKLKEVFRRYVSQPVKRVIEKVNPILRGWVAYFAKGNSSKCLSFVRNWVEKKIRRHLARARDRHGFGWKRWSSEWIYSELGLYDNYRVQYG